VRLHAQLGFTQAALERLALCAVDGDLVALARSCLSANAGDRPADASAVASGVASYLAAVQERLRQAELAETERRAREEEAKRTAAAEARAAMARRTRNLSVALTLVLLLGPGRRWPLASWRFAGPPRRMRPRASPTRSGARP
jgi:hypothetical protein